MNKVVVTGLGVVSSIGTGKKAFWTNLIKGTNGLSKVERFDTSEYNRHIAGEIKNFSPLEYIPKSKIKFIGKAAQYAIAAVKHALVDANLSDLDFPAKKIGVFVGTTMTETSALDPSAENYINETWNKITSSQILNIFSGSIAQTIGSFFKFKGINFLMPTACAAGNYALGYAYDLIRRGEIDLAIVGGADSLSRVAFQGFQRLYAMAPEKCSPFDLERNGMMLGEGAGILILESEQSALRRKTGIYSEILGYGLSCDAHHMTIPNKHGISKALAKALKNSNLKPEQIDYISAHGTGTKQNDMNESAAVKEVLGEYAKKVSMSSIKSMLGHCMGAASAIEALTCCLVLEQGIMPPTINYNTPDPDCDIDCVPNKAGKKEVNIVINNGFAFGGNNCCVAFKKHTE